MNESTARAERFDLQTSTSSSFLWEVAQKPVAVRIPYPLIDRLEREAVESFRSVTSKGSEIGGLLIGTAAAGSPLVVSVADYELIECEYARGPLYRLSDADLVRFQRAIEQRQAGGSGIAGFFRTHTRKGISLDPDDLALMDAHFRGPHQIALLVRPFATKASTGGIFIREDGKINGDASYLEFPFRAPSGEGKAAEAPEAKTAPPIPAPPAPSPSAAKPAARAQIVPIASRRETPAVEEKPEPAPVAVPPAAAPVAAAPVVPAPAPEVPVEEKFIRSDKKADKPAVKTEAKPEAKTEVKPEAKAAAKVETKPAPSSPKPETKATPSAPKAEVKAEPKVEPVPEVKPVRAAATPVAPAAEPEQKSSKSLKLVLAAAGAMILFVALFVYPGLLKTSSKTPTAAGGDSSPLQLRVEPTNGGILLTWNRDSDAIHAATKAVLTINDGEQHENVEMDLSQLRNGSIVYSPQTTDISFKMEVTGRDAAKTTSESVRVLRTRPSALQENAAANGAGKTPTPAAPAQGAPAVAAAPQTAAPAAQTPAAEPAQPEAKPVQPTRAFNAQSLGSRLRAASPSDLPDAPTVGGSAVAPIPGINLGNVAGAAPSAPAPAVPAPPASNQSKGVVKAGGQIQQAVLISKKDPEYPKLARQTGARGAVKLTATVGRDGHVRTVKVLSGHPMLQAAAIEAVKQWVYKPTLLNGQPVETETEIVLNFLGDR